MELPQTLLDRYHVSKPKPKKAEPRQPMYRTYPVTLTFDDGEKIDAEVTMPNKPYWAGQLERDIVKSFNESQPFMEHKVVSVKVYRNSREGGRLIHNHRVIDVY